jgi:agmatine deiminase
MNTISNRVPRELGYRMPAEWEPHQACWMGWPCRESLWGDHLDAARRSYAEVAQAIVEFEPVYMLAPPQHVDAAERACGNTIAVLERPLDDSWLRDTGPIFVVNDRGSLAAVHWGFNGWGNRHTPYNLDAELPVFISKLLNIDRFTANIVFEGGSVHIDGAGTGITTEQCLLNPNRNPDVDRSTIENYLKDYLGIETLIWLGNGLQDDETDGHVDNICFFARPGVVCIQTCHDPEDGNYAASKDNLDRLRSARDAAGRRIEIIELPQPPARYGPHGRLALSYANLYLANDGIVMPSFASEPSDSEALAMVRRWFPERNVVQVDASTIVYGGGGIHCITQQQPLVDGVRT